MDQVSPILTSAQNELDMVGDILQQNSPRIASTMDNLVAMTDDGRVVMNEVRVASPTTSAGFIRETRNRSA